ncbi:hypothetical protein [Streptomyces sp. WAC06614]|uniref:hypothetical protein n=1 Tax=Streptomyces sp. WAC06614 TaxID=2487416 RepID=UPI000F78EE02|nr:hypothetical protein [Streptomyces sp. WAC06614]RSS81166.1 hypothetical protein EF918_11265 [Streptomyces sp. WAC06614]
MKKQTGAALAALMALAAVGAAAGPALAADQPPMVFIVQTSGDGSPNAASSMNGTGQTSTQMSGTGHMQGDGITSFHMSGGAMQNQNTGAVNGGTPTPPTP